MIDVLTRFLFRKNVIWGIAQDHVEATSGLTALRVRKENMRKGKFPVERNDSLSGEQGERGLGPV